VYHLQLDKLNQQSIYSFFNDKIISICVNGTLEWAINHDNDLEAIDYIDHCLINEKTQVKFFLFLLNTMAIVNVNTQNDITTDF
jgi:hypothetical protein